MNKFQNPLEYHKTCHYFYKTGFFIVTAALIVVTGMFGERVNKAQNETKNNIYTVPLDKIQR